MVCSVPCSTSKIPLIFVDKSVKHNQQIYRKNNLDNNFYYLCKSILEMKSGFSSKILLHHTEQKEHKDTRHLGQTSYLPKMARTLQNFTWRTIMRDLY